MQHHMKVQLGEGLCKMCGCVATRHRDLLWANLSPTLLLPLTHFTLCRCTPPPPPQPPPTVNRVQMREVNRKEAKLYGKMFAALGRGVGGGDQGPPAPAAADGAAADAPPVAATAAADGAATMQEDTPPVVQAAA